MQIAPECQLETEEMIIPSLGQQTASPIFFYEPYLHLDLRKLSPMLLQDGRQLPEAVNNLYLQTKILREIKTYLKQEEALNQAKQQLYKLNMRT